jgi:Helix-turn-helix domain
MSAEPLNPLFSLTPESWNALVEQAANLAAMKNREDRWPQWMGEGEAAEYLSLSPKSVGNARRSGKLAGHQHGRTYIYARAELDDFARKGS